MEPIEMFDRPLAITDVETTGLDFRLHEIIDFGLVLVDPFTLEPIHLMDYKVKPFRSTVTDPESIEINGYNEADWQDAESLESVMRLYSMLTDGAIFTAHNVTFDWGFVSEAFHKTSVQNLMDYHRLDLFSLAWAKRGRMPELEKLNLSELCTYFGIPEEPKPHRAINGVMRELEVLRKLSTL